MHKRNVDSVIVEELMPKLYSLIDRLLDVPNVPKDVMVEARKLLPPQYKHSFQNKAVK